MKAILMSIRPRHVANILNRLKTREIRKRFPKEYRGWVYVYCTKDKELLHKNCANIYWLEDKDFQKKNKRFGIETQPYLNGKVVARFYCDNVDSFDWYQVDEELCALSCLTEKQLEDYVGSGIAYAIHISKLEIFDTPKELSEFKSYKKNIVNTKINGMVFETELDNSLTKAPQNLMYIEVEE